MNDAKTLGHIAFKASTLQWREDSLIKPQKSLEWHELGHLQEHWNKAADAVAIHIRTHDKVKEQMGETLRSAKSGLIQLANRNVHWHLDQIEKALAAYEAEKGQE